MTLIIFLQVFMICLLGAMSPGPSMVVVINNAIFKGKHNGILTSIGHGVGITVYATFAVLGLGLIIKTNIFIFNTLKILSIIFLFFIGVQSILNKEKINLDKKNTKEKAVSFLQGLSISILNPKIFVWFIAFFSQFMNDDQGHLYNFILVITAGVVDTCWYIFLTSVATSSVFRFFLEKKSFQIKKFIGLIYLAISIILIIKFYD